MGHGPSRPAMGWGMARGAPPQPGSLFPSGQQSVGKITPSKMLKKGKREKKKKRKGSIPRVHRWGWGLWGRAPKSPSIAQRPGVAAAELQAGGCGRPGGRGTIRGGGGQ